MSIVKLKVFTVLITIGLVGCVSSESSIITRFEEVRNSDACDVIPFTSEKAAEYFEHAIEVTAERYNGESVILPCYWEGTMESGHQKLVWQINASGAGIIQSEDGSIDRRFLCQGEASSESQCCTQFPELCE